MSKMFEKTGFLVAQSSRLPDFEKFHIGVYPSKLTTRSNASIKHLFSRYPKWVVSRGYMPNLRSLGPIINILDSGEFFNYEILSSWGAILNFISDFGTPPLSPALKAPKREKLSHLKKPSAEKKLAPPVACASKE